MRLSSAATRKTFTLGTDPEMFVLTKKNQLIPAFTFLPPKSAGRNVYWDGFQAEWKLKTTPQCIQLFVSDIQQQMVELHKAAKRKKGVLSLTNVLKVPEKTLQTAAMQHVQFGCMPSFNVYGMRGLELDNPRDLKHRFAGGHIHFGSWNQQPPYEPIVTMMDRILGVWSVGAAQKIDNPIRRQYYGLAGEYRKPKYKYGYGVEYRVLSNFWLAHPSLTNLTMDIARKAVRVGLSPSAAKEWKVTTEETIECINSSNVDLAKEILKRNKRMFSTLFVGTTYNPSATAKALEVANKGIGEFFDLDVTKNWKLRSGVQQYWNLGTWSDFCAR
jgi:hypothetical protein